MKPEERVRLAAAIREILAIVEGVDVPEDRHSGRRVKRQRRAPTLTRPAGESSPEVAAMAKRALRERGFT